MSTVLIERYSPEEYLDRERVAGHKSEYYCGQIFAMAGAGEAHNIIVANLIRHMGNALDKSPCRVYPTDMRVKCPTGLYTYPDISIVCGEREFDDDRRDTLLNPRVLFEVLSPSTEAYDRGRKSEHYRTLTSLQEYVLIAQDRVSVTRFRRPDGGPWTWSVQTDPMESLTLGSCGATVNIADIYAGVEFPPLPADIVPADRAPR